MPTPERLWSTLLNTLFPAICLSCESSLPDAESGRHLCTACLSEVSLYSAFACPHCEGRIPSLKKPCHPKAIYTLAPAASYDDLVVQRLIWRLKYKRVRTAATPLASIIIANLQQLNLDLNQYLITPIPLHPSRQRNRGFNQANLIASIIGNYFNQPVHNSILKRSRQTEYQAQLKSHRERFSNLENAFQVIDAKSVQGRNILLVDDVSTSGATLQAAAQSLKKAGAHKIISVVAAKA